MIAASKMLSVRGNDGFDRVTVDAALWESLAEGAAAGLHDFSGIWLDRTCVSLLLVDSTIPLRLIVSLPVRDGCYPAVSRFHAPASRLERALRDLNLIEPVGLPDPRAWLDHGVWPHSKAGPGYAFLPSEGEGLHQIPVGPVHAGIIEPGHFRFTVNGEAVVRLEERLGYVHKGIAGLCVGADSERAGKLAARISGDATVAYSFAFALAVESALGVVIPPRAALLRGIMAELERLSHHVNDVGAICNDASVVALHARSTLIREHILQCAESCFGHRLMMDRIVPGGVASDLSAEGINDIEKLLRQCTEDFEAVVRVYDSLPSLQDRTMTTGIVAAHLVKQFAAGGHVGRASGRAFDTRKDFPYAPYDGLDFTPVLRGEGDVNDRVWVRIEEARTSMALIGEMLRRLEPGPIRADLPTDIGGEGAAMVESFRGDVLLALRLERGKIAAFHARDPSWFQWPLLEAAIEGNIVADFPLCNKSFNCSYAGHDM